MTIDHNHSALKTTRKHYNDADEAEYRIHRSTHDRWVHNPEVEKSAISTIRETIEQMVRSTALIEADQSLPAEDKPRYIKTIEDYLKNVRRWLEKSEAAISKTE
jgi:hypothetical protein